MAIAHYHPDQVPPPPPAIIRAATPIAREKKPDVLYLNQLPNQSDGLPYDHAFPFGVDPNDSSKPYAPHGVYCDENGNNTGIPIVSNEKQALQSQLSAVADPSNSASPLNVYNIESPMDPGNMQQFFYAQKPGSPWHQYERQPDQEAPWEEKTEIWNGREVSYWAPEQLPGYLGYSDHQCLSFKDTPENFPWLHDQDPSHHYRRNSYDYSGAMFASVCPFIDFKGHPPITEQIYLDSPVAPVGWHAVRDDK